jgi:hypothetical protein
MKTTRYLFLLAMLASSALVAQTARLHGQVADESGAVVPGASVVLVGSAGLVQSTTADEQGTYSFANVPPGNYTVRASARLLSQAQPARVSLRAGSQVLDLILKVDSLTEKVTVRENSAPALSTESSNNASAVVLSGGDLDALSDDPNDLAADLQALAGPSAGPNGGAIFVDGFSGGELPAKGSIREIRINQNPFSPEYDKLGYGKIEIFTKPGSDKYHAEINYNFANQFWNSRNPYAPDKAHFLLDEFEGGGGGPLGHRASFTVDAQRNMVDNGTVTNAVTLNPQSLAVEPFAGSTVIPGRYTRVSPRIDDQLNQSHTLMFRYGVTHSDVRDNGVGGLDLATRAYHSQFTNQTAQAADTLVRGATVNETRFQYYRSAVEQIADSLSPQIVVLGAFNGGGSPFGSSFDTQNSYELQNYTSILRRAHSLRFGVRLRAQTEASTSPQNFDGTFTFAGTALAPVLDARNQPVVDGAGQPEAAPITSIESYRRTLVFQQLGYSPQQIRNLGGGATQFSMNAGTPGLAVHQVDAGVFAGDDWRLRPNLTLSFGLRYETQTNIHDRSDVAPRIAIAWAPAATAGNQRAKTVLRAGFGMFYDRFALANTLTAARMNGTVQQQYAVDNPDFFPEIPSPAALAAFRSSQVIEEVSSGLRAPYIMQSAFTVERQLPGNTTIAATYTNSHGVHLFRSTDINAPLPGTYNSSDPGSGTFPLGHAGPFFLMESSGLYNQNQFIANVNSRLKGVSLFGFYVFNRALSNTDGINTFPANPYDSRGEYSSASTDVRHRFNVGGSINLKWKIRISPFVVVQSGTPFDITAGSDLYGTTLFNGRPGVATDPNQPGVIRTAYGLLDPNPSPGEALLPRNYGTGPALVAVNLRLAKTIGFGGEKGGSAGEQRPDSGTATALAAVSGRGLGRVLGTPSTSRRFNLTFGLSVRNLLNHTNPGPIIGNITSPLFGSANQIAGGPNGEGFYENANNRRLESQIRFMF